MKCITCGFQIPHDNAFCGRCGTPTNEDIEDVKSYLTQRLPLIVQRAIDEKIDSMSDRNLVINQVTEQATDRMITIIDRFKYIIGIPLSVVAAVVTILLAVFSFMGWNNLDALEEFTSQAEDRIVLAEARIEEQETRIQSGADDAAERAMDAVVSAEAAKVNVEALNADAKTIQSDIQALKTRLEERASDLEREIDDFKQANEQASALLGQFEEYKTELDALQNVPAKIAALNEEVAKVETLKLRLRAQEELTQARATTNVRERIKTLTKALTIYPNFPEALIERGTAFLKDRQAGQAVGDLEKVKDLPEDARRSVWDDRALVQLGIGKLLEQEPDGGVLALEEAIRDNPTNSDAQMHVGRYDFQNGRLPEAIARFKRADAILAAAGEDPRLAKLWQHLVALSRGVEDPLAPKAKFQMSETTDQAKIWPGPLLELFSGVRGIPSVDYLSGRNSGDPDARRTCEADFYIAMHLKLIDGDATGAKARFRQARSNCDGDRIEYVWATQALRELDAL